MQRRHQATLAQPFQCDLQPRLQETHRTTHTGTTIVAKHIQGTKRPQPQPPHTRGTFHRRLQPLYTEKHKISCSGFLPTTHSMQHSWTHSNAIRNHSFKKRIELRTTHRRNQTTAAATAAHTRYLSSPAAATLHGKTQGFVLRLPPQNKAHATFMQPFQCDLQPQLQETHRTTHTGTTIVAKHIQGTKRPQPQPPHTRGTFHRRLQPLYTEKHKVSSPQHTACNIHATHSNAICNHSFKKHCCKTHRRNQTTAAATAAHTRYLSSLAAATLHGKTQGFVLRLPPQNKAHATFMQPFQCDPQPQLQETHRTTHTGTTIVAKHIEGTKRPQPQPPLTRGTLHRRLQPLYTEKQKVSCSGFLTTKHSMQHSCAHSNAIRNHSFKKRIELHTGTTAVARHIEGTKRPQPHPSHTRGTFHRRLQPLYTEKHKVSSTGFLHKT